MTEERYDLLPETITAPRTDPIYNCHAYLTKVPVGAITPFIEAFSKPGDTIADPYAGSGMTGIAARLSKRNALLSDISVLGRHIAMGYLVHVQESDFRQAARRVIEIARRSTAHYYETKRQSDGQAQEMIRTVWSFSYVCPLCNQVMTYFEHVDNDGSSPKECPSCNHPFVKRKWERSDDVPVRVVVIGDDGKQKEQPLSEIDFDQINSAKADPRLNAVPSAEIEKDREMYSRSGLGKSGMTNTAKFFTPRNAIVLLELWNAIAKEPDPSIRHKLRFAFTAILPRASKRYQWSAKRPLNAQNQTYYIAPVHYEWNVFQLFERKVSAAVNADKLVFTETDADQIQPRVSYELASADHLKHIEDRSVDYVFTDPPFGSNIFYSDMNLFHEAWLGTLTNHHSEAVVHTTGKRKSNAEERYERLLKLSFAEGLRILKPGAYMSVVFGNSNGRIWGLVQRALRDAGFKSEPVHVAILDKGQRSVKGLSSGAEGVVTVDLVVTVQKPYDDVSSENARQVSDADKQHLIAQAISELPEAEAKNPSYLYARILKNAIRTGLLLDDLHLGDVLVALRQAGYGIDRKSARIISVNASRPR